MNDLTPEQIGFLNKYAKVWWYNNETGLIDCENFDCIREGIYNIPVKFGRCEKRFDCSYNSLSTLEGCPNYVGNFFNCGCNRLTSLKGGPISVRNTFFADCNYLTTLEGCPDYVGGNFTCQFNSGFKSIKELFKLILS